MEQIGNGGSEIQNHSGLDLEFKQKIINNLSNEFEHLHYQSAKTKVFQCDKLLQKSLTAFCT